MLLFIILSFLGSVLSSNLLIQKRQIAQPKTSQREYALPNNITVNHYNIVIEPDFTTDTFRGSTSVSFTTLENTNVITIHAHELEIEESSLNISGNNAILRTSYSNDDRQFYTITFAEELEEGITHTLTFGDYIGILNDNKTGFYLGKYLDEFGNERKFGTTQFEQIYARKAFPCFDEPALKANFTISIIRSNDYHSISNFPLESTTDLGNGRYLDKFQTTLRMSTYLVAFVVSDFGSVTLGTDRVFLRKAYINDNRGDLALKYTRKVIKALEDFLNVSYVFPKMDQVGIPEGYFAAGAMENWGLVIYRESALAFLDGVGTSRDQERVLSIIAHEFGHQWFGNLVSPLWWKYAWLNEGFATYLSYLGSSIVEEGMDRMNRILIGTVHNALRNDANRNTRPMNQDAGSPSDISSLFDEIAYVKSASVIRMVEGILGTNAFTTGLYYYLTKMQFDAAQPSDLYSSWQQAVNEHELNDIFPSGEDVASVMATWDSNAGYPLVRVTRNYENGTVNFYQRRYITGEPDNDVESIWYVPISYATSTNTDFNNTVPKFWLTTRSEEVVLNDLKSDDFLLTNLMQNGYYRVTYDTENWNRIADFLYSDSFNKITKTSRAQLLEDSFELAKDSVIDYAIPLKIFRYIVKETDYIPLSSYYNALYYLDVFMSNTPVYKLYQDYIVKQLNATFMSVGLDETDDDSHVTKLNRIQVLNWVCKYGDMRCRQGALERLNAWATDSVAFPPNLKRILTCSALSIGGQSSWNFVFQLYTIYKSSDYVAALGCSEDAEILNNFMNRIVNTDDILPKHRLEAWLSIVRWGTFGVAQAYKYFKNNFSALRDSLTTSELDIIFHEFAEKFIIAGQYDDFRNFTISVGYTLFDNAENTEMRQMPNAHLKSILNWFQANTNVKIDV